MILYFTYLVVDYPFPVMEGIYTRSLGVCACIFPGCVIFYLNNDLLIGKVFPKKQSIMPLHIVVVNMRSSFCPSTSFPNASVFPVTVI